MKIVIDAMGGDNAPDEIIAGALQAVADFENVEVILVGIEDRIKKQLSRFRYPEDKLSVIHAPEVVTMHDSAVTALRKKRESSISIGVNLLKDPQYNAFISAGNTGAVVAASTDRKSVV